MLECLTQIMEFELNFLFATMILISVIFALLMYSITPEQPKTIDNEKI